MDPNNPNPNQQPQNSPPQPQAPIQPQVVVGASPYAAQPTMPVQPTQQPMAQPIAASANPGNKNMIIIIIAVVILVLIVGTVIGVLLLHKKSPTMASTSGSSQGSTGSSSALATSKNACELFTLSDAQAILGSSATVTPQNSLPDVSGVTLSGCGYSDNTTDASIDLQVESPSNGSMTVANNLYIIWASGGTSVSGLGDKAAYSSATPALLVQKGNIVLSTNYTDGNGNPAESTDILIAKTMLANF